MNVRAQVASGLRQGVMMLTMHAPPVNSLSPSLLAELAEIMDFSFSEPSVRGVVLTGHGLQFSSGADLSEWSAAGKSDQQEALAALCQLIEGADKPVVVALQGDANGAGLELALAAHRRIALATARFSFPELRLGQIPGAGGTQRLPRLIGAPAALEMLLKAEQITAATALAMGLVDQVVGEGLLVTAVEEAVRLSKSDISGLRTSTRRDGFRNGAAYGAAIASARAKVKAEPNPVETPARIIDCVEAAWLLPFTQGIAYEAAALRELKLAPESSALHHAFLSENHALRLPQALAAAPAVVPSSLAFWGAGPEAADLAALALGAGMRVALCDISRDRLVAALERIAARQEAAVQQGRISSEQRDADWARLAPNTRQKALEGADLVMVDGTAGDVAADLTGQVIALNGAALAGGMAFHPPMALGNMAELSIAENAPVAPQALILGLCRKLAWKLVCSGQNGPIDRALRATFAAVLAQVEAQGIERPQIARALSGAGMGVPYAGAVATSAATADLVPACLAALANRGARLWREGAARQVSDVDAIATLSGLVPRWIGGPMYWADQRGLLALRADLRRRAETNPELYAPDPLFDALLADGRGLFTRSGR